MADFESTLNFSLSNKVETCDPDVDEAPNRLVHQRGVGGLSAQQAAEV